MRWRSVGRLGSVCVVATLMALAGARLDGQSTSRPAEAKALPRTPDGHPDLQGVFDYATATPLQRPAAYANKSHFTEAEAADFKRTVAANRARAEASDSAPLPAGQVGGYNQFWYEFGTTIVPDRRTSLITYPENGLLPPLTADAQKRADLHRANLRRFAEGPEDRDASERCLLGYNSGPPMVGVGYNQHVQIVQTPSYVVLHNEMVHTARVVRLDGRPFSPDGMHTWGGNSRGHWDGDTLVVETRNFNDQQWNQFSGWNWASDEKLRVVERFSLGDANTVQYEATVDDPTVWTSPWTMVAALRRTDDLMFEYACHEGNHGMEGILRGARAEERRLLEGARPAK
jgi:hypothetical protein